MTAPWTDVEIMRFLKRQDLFSRSGLSPADGEQLAEKCLLRDRDMDDRRMCIECRNLQRGGGCRATSLAFPKTLLVRCARFEWAIPKAAAREIQ